MHAHKHRHPHKMPPLSLRPFSTWKHVPYIFTSYHKCMCNQVSECNKYASNLINSRHLPFLLIAALHSISTFLHWHYIPHTFTNQQCVNTHQEGNNLYSHYSILTAGSYWWASHWTIIMTRSISHRPIWAALGVIHEQKKMQKTVTPSSRHQCNLRDS